MLTICSCKTGSVFSIRLVGLTGRARMKIPCFEKLLYKLFIIVYARDHTEFAFPSN